MNDSDNETLRTALTKVRDNCAEMIVSGVKFGDPVHAYREFAHTFATCDLWLKFDDAAKKAEADGKKPTRFTLEDNGPRPL